MEHDIGTEGTRRTVADRWSKNTERELPSTVPIKSSGGCSQGGDVRIDRDIRQSDSSPVEFEVHEVRRTRLHVTKPCGKIHCDINRRPALRKRYGAKRRGSRTTCDMVGGEIKADGAGRNCRGQ